MIRGFKLKLLDFPKLIRGTVFQNGRGDVLVPSPHVNESQIQNSNHRLV